MIGLSSGIVLLSDYHGSWPDHFARERDRLAAALGPNAVEIAHIGSTAMPGAAAKPIIDIMLGTSSRDAGPSLVPAMQRLGYRALGEFGIAGRQFLKLGEPTTHHVHMVARGSDFWNLNILFRDWMIAHPDTLEAYVTLKRDLARRHAGNRDAYTSGKDAFIKRVLHDAGWRGGFAG